jgi:hypothetical protein
MKARQLIGSASYSPDVLRVIYDAFDDAWAEVAPSISARASAIEAARVSLANIVLGVASAGPIDRNSLKAAAVNAFRSKHGGGQPGL